MANENDSTVKIMSDCFIKPNCNVEQSKHPYYLTAIDLYHLSKSYMHRGLLYSKPHSFSSDDVKSLVDKLKHSLSIALVDFYPLAGRLETVNYEDDHSSWVYVDCNKGPGARFMHAATTELSVSDVIVSSGEGISRHICSFFDGGDRDIVNHSGHTRALLSVQVTDLVDGVFIGFAMNHTVGDGTSLWYFINALSKVFMDHKYLCNSDSKPIFKPVFPDGYGPVIKLPYLDPDEFKTHHDNVDPRLTLRVFHFTTASIARLKAQANDENINNNTTTTTISSFQALSAFMWLSVTKARNLPLESDTSVWMIAGTRPKHDPPLPSNHFGNFLHGIPLKSNVKELNRHGLGWAATQVHNAVARLDNNYINQFSKAAYAKAPKVAQVSHFDSQHDNDAPLFFVGSMRFDAYGPEFGLGKVIATRPGLCTWINGRIVVDPGRERGGSANLQVCLLSETMTALESDDEFMSFVS